MHLDVRETVNVIVRTWPGASEVLRRHGLDDLLWWAGTPLDEACRAQGIDLEVVVGEIERQVDPDVARAFKAQAAQPKAARGAAPAARGYEPPPSVTRMLADPEQERMPDVDAVFRRPARALLEEQEAPVEEEAPPPPEPVDDGMPDVAQVFKVRAGTPDAPFLHAHKPAPPLPPPLPELPPPEPEPVLDDEPDTEVPDPEVVARLIQQAVAAGLEWASSDSARVAAQPPDGGPDLESLQARRQELQAQLQALLAMRERALSQLAGVQPLEPDDPPSRTVAGIFDDDDPRAPLADPEAEPIYADEEPDPDDLDELEEVPETDDEVVDAELAESLEAPAGEADPEQAAPDDARTWAAKLRSWFAA